MWRKRISSPLLFVAFFTALTHAQYAQPPEQQVQIQVAQPTQQQPVYFNLPHQQQQQQQAQYYQPQPQQQPQQQAFNPFSMFFRPSQQFAAPSNNQQQFENFPILSRLMSAFKNAFKMPVNQQQQQQQQQFQQNPQQYGPMQASNTVYDVVPPPPQATRQPNFLGNLFG